MDLDRFLEEHTPFTEKEKEDIRTIKEKSAKGEDISAEKAEVLRWLDTRHATLWLAWDEGLGDYLTSVSFRDAADLAVELELPARVLCEEANRQTSLLNFDRGDFLRDRYVEFCERAGAFPLNVPAIRNPDIRAVYRHIEDAKDEISVMPKMEKYIDGNRAFSFIEKTLMANLVLCASMREELDGATEPVSNREEISEELEQQRTLAEAGLKAICEQRPDTLEFLEAAGFQPELIDYIRDQTIRFGKDFGFPVSALEEQVAQKKAESERAVSTLESALADFEIAQDAFTQPEKDDSEGVIDYV